jgi:hypothetical protein
LDLIISHVAVEESASSLNSVFGVDQFLLQLAKMGICFQLRVLFDNDKQTLQGSNELTFVVSL